MLSLHSAKTISSDEGHLSCRRRSRRRTLQPWTYARELVALTNTFRLEWPNTKPTLTASLESLGRFINTYRNTIGAALEPGEPGARNPIQRIAIAQALYYYTHS